MIKNNKISEDLTWIEVNNITHSDEKKILGEKIIDRENLLYTTDENEIPRTDYDPKKDLLLLIFDVLTVENGNETTYPVSFIFKGENTFISFTDSKTEFVNDMIKEAIKNDDHDFKNKFFYDLLYKLSAQYIEGINRISKKRKEIQSQLKYSISPGEIDNLMNLEISIIYIEDSLNSDEEIIADLKDFLISKDKLSAKKEERVVDIEIEIVQGKQNVAEINNVVRAISTAYTNVNNSRLDKTMRFLTLLQALLAIPTVITGFYGMNVALPFEGSKWAWLFIIITALLMIIIELIIITKKNFLD